MKLINGIKNLINLYDVFIIDQWGVMHNGKEGYSYAIECINYLKEHNKQLIIISNSSKRKKSSINKLSDLGFSKYDFEEVLTSGEMIWNEINFFLSNYGKDLNKCLHIFDKSKEDGLDFRIGLDKIVFTDEIKDADFILACTPFKNSKPIDYVPLLNTAIEKNIKMFCANPDFETIEIHKENNIYCMGTIAQLYNDMGGEVIIMGKPSIDIYVEATKSLKHDKSKYLAIGDSLFHDIKGALNFGIDSLLITSGIHKEMFSLDNPIWEDPKNTLLEYDITPNFICKNFSI